MAITGLNSVVYNGQKLVSVSTLDKVKELGLDNFKKSIVVTRDGYLVAQGKVYSSEDVLSKAGIKVVVKNEVLTITDVHGNEQSINISNLVPAEVTSRIATVEGVAGTNTEDIAAIKKSLESISTTENVTKMISDAVAALEEADAALGGRIDGEISARKTAITEVKGLVTAEEERALAAEAANKKAIEDEVTRATGVEGELKSAIETEVSNRKTAVEGVAGDLADEIARAKAAEGDNETAINEEIARAKGEEATIKASVTSEIANRTAADETLQANIDAEVTRAKKAEETNANAISAETTRATKEEERLAGLIASNTSSISTNTNNITSLGTRLTTAEGSISTNASAIEKLQSDLGAITGTGTSGIDGKISAAINTHDIYATTTAQGHVELWGGNESALQNSDKNDYVVTATQLKNAKDTLAADITTNKNNISVNATAISNLESKVNNNKTDLETAIATAKSEAISDAQTDASTKANAAQAAAEATAATDATTKANQALANAKTYTDVKVTTLNASISSAITEAKGYTNTHAGKISTQDSAAHVYISGGTLADVTAENKTNTAASVTAVEVADAALQSQINDVKGLISGGLVYKGSVTSMPSTTDAKTGDMYKVSQAFDVYEAGDMLIFNGSSFDAIQANIDGAAVVSKTNFGGGIVYSTGDNELKSASVGEGMTFDTKTGQLSINIGASNNGDILGVYKGEDGKLYVDASNVDTNTWRAVQFLSGDDELGYVNKALGTEALKFGTAFNRDANGYVDLAWFEID
jgi:hypothetical protein